MNAAVDVQPAESSSMMIAASSRRHFRSADIALHIDTCKAERRRFAHRLDRKERLLIPLRGVGREPVQRETPRGILDGPLVFGERKIHSRDPVLSGVFLLLYSLHGQASLFAPFPEPACAASAATTGRAGWSPRITLSRGRFHLAALRDRRREQARSRSRRCPAWNGCRSIWSRRAAEEAAKLGIPVIALFPEHRSVAQERRRARGAERRTISSAAPCARSRRRCRRSACSAMWRSIPIPATAMTAS